MLAGMGSLRTILIVDDDADVRAALTLLLEAHHLNVRAFDSALAFLRAEPGPDDACLLLDLHMPFLDGATLQELLDQNQEQLPTIVLTAYPDGALARRALASGARALLSKPVSAADLLREIESVLSNARQ